MLKGLVALVVLDTNVFAPDVMEVLDPISTDRVHLWQALCRFRAAAADVCADALMNAGSIYIGRGWCALEGDATRVSGYALDKYTTSMAEKKTTRRTSAILCSRFSFIFCHSYAFSHTTYTGETCW